MALDPHLFTAPHLGRQRLRDHIIDLNQSMDLEAIVTKMLATLRSAAKTHPFARHFLDAHTPAERRRIVETNLRRLRIRFAAADVDTVAGASESMEEWWYVNVINWWDDLWAPSPGSTDDAGADDPDDTDGSSDSLMGNIERNGAEYLRDTTDEMDGK
jgi:hypothetical protein